MPIEGTKVSCSPFGELPVGEVSTVMGEMEEMEEVMEGAILELALDTGMADVGVGKTSIE